MLKLKTILNHQAFFPVLMLYYGVFYILFGEVYPANEGLSTDGYVFASLVSDFKNSFYFDAYYVHRIFPSLIVRIFFNTFSININNQNIFSAFQILNLVGITLSCYFLKKIFILFNIGCKKQLLGFTLFLINFGIMKFPFYLPVMTDTLALMLGTALLYFYLKNNTIGIIACTIMLAFTWPMGYYQGLLLIAFPINSLPFSQPFKWQKSIVHGISVMYIIILITIFIIIEKRDIEISFVARIDKNLLPLSIAGIILLYFFFAKIFLNKTLLNVSLFFNKINYKRLIVSVFVFSIVFIIIHFLNPNPIPTYSTAQTLRDPTIYSLIKPLITIVSHTTYFGMVICIVLLFWNSFCKTVSQMGWGLVAALGLNLFLFGITPQSRHLINILPWIIVFLMLTINKYSFSNSFYVVVGILCFITSKIWLSFNNYADYPPMQLDKNGSIGFPHQKLWMNIGPWMNEQMYFFQGAILLAFMAIIFALLYKIKITESKKIQLTRRYDDEQ